MVHINVVASSVCCTKSARCGEASCSCGHFKPGSKYLSRDEHGLHLLVEAIAGGPPDIHNSRDSPAGHSSKLRGVQLLSHQQAATRLP